MRLGRTILSPSRQKNIKNTNLGHMILFCEGLTEKYYFEYFTDIIEKNKFNDVRIEIESADGNSRRVLKFADDYLTVEDNNRKYSNYKKYLVFDCDAPPNIQKIIDKICLSENGYEMLVSNYLFETWLLMHFENVTEKISKEHTYKRLSEHLVNEYKKASSGLIREIIQNGSVEEAMKNAERLAEKYSQEGKNICNSIGKMNPYTNVNILVEQLLAVIS
jgi:hypothetical protein